MTDFGMEFFAEFLGGGGDVKFDRIPQGWPGYSGYEPESHTALDVEEFEKVRIEVL